MAGILAGIAPELRRGIAVDDHHVDQPVEVEIGERRTPRLLDAGDAGLVAGFRELAVALLQQQVVGILHREVGHVPDIALGDEQIDEAVIVHVLELRMPGRAGLQVFADIGPVRGDALGVGNVGV